MERIITCIPPNHRMVGYIDSIHGPLDGSLFVNLLLFSLSCWGLNKYFMLAINVGKLFLHSFLVAYHAGKFWLQV